MDDRRITISIVILSNEESPSKVLLDKRRCEKNGNSNFQLPNYSATTMADFEFVSLVLDRPDTGYSSMSEKFGKIAGILLV